MAALALALGLSNASATAHPPSVADLDATARAAGNRLDIAQRIGDAIFTTQWPAEVNQVSANELGAHLIVGVRLWGVKFHQPMTRAQFVDEIVSLAEQVFTAEPATEEIDFWASVPIAVGKGVIVSGDLAKPTSRTVFSVTVQRSETAQELRNRAMLESDGVFWDDDWVRAAFAPAS